MTNELEKQFFQCFGIEPKPTCVGCELWINECYYDCGEFYLCKADLDRDTCGYKGTNYPQITDRILLELICILTEWRQYCASDYIIKAININILKNDILKDCLYMLNWYEFKKCGKDIKHQVRTLFEEG